MSGNPKVILVVEDDHDFCSFLEQLLTQEEYEVKTAQDGSEGYEQALSEVPDLIVTDLVMPNMGGVGIDSKNIC